MTTSKPTSADAVLPLDASLTDATDVMSSVMSGNMPDVAVLTRMANAFFTALPEDIAAGSGDMLGAGAEGSLVPAAEANLQAINSMLLQAGNEFLPIMDAVAPGFDAGAGRPGAETIPLLGAPAAASTVQGDPAAFYFLNDAMAVAQASAATPRALPAAADFVPQVVPDVRAFGQGFDVNAVRRDFPILQQTVHGRPLIWLDSGATSQKPQSVIDRLAHFYAHENSNIHRGAHHLAARATDAYEGARETVRRFLNAPAVEEIVFVRGTTEAINLVAQTFGRQNVQKGDEIVITWLEHHANIVPWQLLCNEKGAKLRVVPVDDHGEILLDAYERLLTPATRLVALTHVSNALGTVLPVAEMTAIAHRHGARVLVDGAQAVPHMAVDVQDIDCDFYVFSGHKMFAPTGIGVLHGKQDVLAGMSPWQGGGNMISDVTFERTVYQAPPFRFEAGTGNIADAVGLAAAIDYMEKLGMRHITRHESDLMAYALQELGGIPGIRIIGKPQDRAGVISFIADGVRTEDVGQALDLRGIAVRAGHHCAQPALRRFDVESTVRPSFAAYNTCTDIDGLSAAMRDILRVPPKRAVV